ncbi:MAG: hypothetical protein JO253_03585 [Alphaproteobacteria bacterium]|nr:hypothetical protein [Alphaproteobacteria bacterium]
MMKNRYATLWTDATGAFYVREDVPSPETGQVVPTWYDAFSAEQKIPGQGAMPADAPHSGPIRLTRSYRVVNKSGNATYNVGDILIRVTHFYWQKNTLRVQWLNASALKVVSQQSAPPAGDIVDIESAGPGFVPTTASNNATIGSTAANTDAIAIAANNARQFLSVSNNSSGVLTVNFGNPAYSSGAIGIALAAGATKEWSTRVPTTAVHMSCTVSNPTVFVIEG